MANKFNRIGVMIIPNDKYIVIDRKKHSDNVKKSLLGKDVGRPFKVTEETVKAILSDIESGMSYRKAAEKYGVSFGLVYKISHSGMEYCERIKKRNKTKRDNSVQPQAAADVVYIHTRVYADNLQKELQRYNLNLSKDESLRLIQNVLNMDNKSEVKSYEFYEYHPDDTYIELTTHSLHKKRI